VGEIEPEDQAHDLMALLKTQTVAVIKTAPSEDVAVMALYHESLGLLRYAELRVITIIEQLKPAAEDLALIRKLRKTLEWTKKEWTGPIREKLDAVNAAFKILLEPIEQADKITSDKMLAFDREQQRIRQEQENINRLREEAAQKQKELTGEITEVERVEVAPEAPHRIFTEVGTAGQRENWKWQVVDINLVPREYLMINAGMLTPVVKASKGRITIPGVRIYNEPILQVNVR